MQVDKTELAREFINLVPQARALQLEITEIHDGIAVIRMPYDPALVGERDRARATLAAARAQMEDGTV